jgi:hypothetical protein
VTGDTGTHRQCPGALGPRSDDRGPSSELARPPIAGRPSAMRPSSWGGGLALGAHGVNHAAARGPPDAQSWRCTPTQYGSRNLRL